jgi:hypothetical protein
VPLSCAHALTALATAITVRSGIRIRRDIIGSLYSSERTMKSGKRGQPKRSQSLDLPTATAPACTGPRNTWIEIN